MHNVESDSWQKREIFHLEFLRWLFRRVPAEALALKGGTNLRFFFRSIRYSEDMDLDARTIPVHALRERVMAILTARTLLNALRSVGILSIIPPDIKVAKQTETVQRFKVRLVTNAGDLSTKVEFSRRGMESEVRAEPVASEVLAAYRMPPLIVPHYLPAAAVRQKIRALAGRSEPQARDVFDLYMLRGQPEASDPAAWRLRPRLVGEARDRALSFSYVRYRDTVVAFLHPDDRATYDSPRVWEEIQLSVAGLLERGLTS